MLALGVRLPPVRDVGLICDNVASLASSKDDCKGRCPCLRPLSGGALAWCARSWVPPPKLQNNNRTEYLTSVSGLFTVFSLDLRRLLNPVVSFPVNDENTVSSSVPGRDKGEVDVV